MANIKLSYLYRDAANYKKHSFVILNNPRNKLLSEIETLIRLQLIDDTWFYADYWNLPELLLPTFGKDDPTWHEFDELDYIEEVGKQDVDEFLRAIRN
ncbi:hypothetical protein GWR56_06070 [Mucilaginibacter sp. 14171R-50]|uniref:hypothetical protein n=1 Tax=Mucilaginibacter sp. 14171R-50 TaxID=2703789 RepID=UPI00138C5EAD|nr:hypothetical protein [Mucilaginibacter sp. 14171R-50]QHS55124.1 hypothetical protein GWR56_06070 [Mucilaginibacter sp. 14171R-50]